MSLSLNLPKKRILEVLGETGKPVKISEIAKRVGLSLPASMMHLIWMKRNGIVDTPEKGYYVITELGKETLNVPYLDKKRALTLLSSVPKDKAFHFWTKDGRYLGVYAVSLDDFYYKIQTIDVHSLEFHIFRRDVEHWLQALGDVELAKKISMIRNMSVTGEELREKVSKIFRSRCEELRNALLNSP